jgi:L-aspartate semialdehyde sulfurtransferase
MGTRIFLGGGIGYVVWQGTQHSPAAPRNERGVPTGGAATLAGMGDLKQMSPKWLRGASLRGYGTSMYVGIGIPLPILDEEVAAQTAVTDADILAPVVDYSGPYPAREPEVICHVTYAQLKSGEIEVEGKKVPTTPLASYPIACEIAAQLKEWITSGKFELTAPVVPLPGPESGLSAKPMPYHPVKNAPSK